MSEHAYCTVEQVASFLGRSLTAAEHIEAARLINAATAEIDGETNRTWLQGAITNEAFYFPFAAIWLQYTPVASVQAVRARTGLEEDEETLTVNVDYEVRDLAAGLVVLTAPRPYQRITVDYTQADGVPGDIEQACVELVAARLSAALHPGSYGVDSIQLPDYTVRYSRAHMQQAYPPNVARILARNRYMVAQ
jgi:hypothetical protein